MTILRYASALLIVSSSLFGWIEVVRIPKREAAVVDLSTLEMVKEDIACLITGKLHAIGYMTAREAREYLSEYLRQTYGEVRGAHYIKIYLTDEYFARPELQARQEVTIDCVLQAPLRNVTNMLQHGNPGREGTMANARKRWPGQALLCTPEQVYTALLKFGVGRKLREEGLHTLEQYRKKYPDKAEEIFSSKYFGVPEDMQDRTRHFLTTSFGFLTHDLINNIFVTAERIMRETKQGDYIVIFGNTPYFVGRALKQLISRSSLDEHYRKIIEFPFSGSPNRARPYKRPNRKDFVTKERLLHLKHRLKKSGLHPSNPDLIDASVYFVDALTSGSGPAYVFEELVRMFQETGRAIPDFRIIAINRIRRFACIAKRSDGDREKLTLHFPSIDDTHFTIDAQVIYLEGYAALDMSPSSEWRVFPEYSAAYWVPEYDYLLEGTDNAFTKTLLEYFDVNIARLIEQNTGDGKAEA